MGRHNKPVLVRVWVDGYTNNPVNIFTQDWDSKFTITSSHPAAYALMQCHNKEIIVTVMETEELEWLVQSVHISGTILTVLCVPRITILRSCLFPDEKIKDSQDTLYENKIY